MKARHTVLVVEDDREIGEEVVEILRSLDCESILVDNVEDAVNLLDRQQFCMALLDLQIKGAPDSIKGHVEHGRGLLRTIRTKYGEHNGTCFSFPVLIVSGYAREADAAVDVMKDGASDVIQKPLDSGRVSGSIRHALQNSGRQTHEACGATSGRRRLGPDEEIVLAVPGDRIRRRTRVTISGVPVTLTDASLKVLLHLMVAYRKKAAANKADLGAKDEQGFKGISILRNELKLALGDREIIENDYHGNYGFVEGVMIGEGSLEKLLEIGDHTISRLARELWQEPSPTPKKSEGNSAKFPAHRRRRGI